MRATKKFITALKISEEPAYKLTWRAKVHPNYTFKITLSKLVTGYLRPRPNDKRLLRVGKLLGLKPDEILEGDDYALR